MGLKNSINGLLKTKGDKKLESLEKTIIKLKIEKVMLYLNELCNSKEEILFLIEEVHKKLSKEIISYSKDES